MAKGYSTTAYKVGIDKAQQIFDFIVEHVREYGYSPTVREITDVFSIRSTSISNYYIGVLTEWGWIKRGEPRSARSLQIIHPLYVTFPEDDVKRVFQSLADVEARKAVLHPEPAWQPSLRQQIVAVGDGFQEGSE